MTDTAQNALTVHDGAQQPMPAMPKTPLMAGHSPRAIVPVDFEGAYRIANVVHKAGMAPKSLNSIEKVMVAILHGLEVGLTPMNALQSIAVINGRPTIWGDGAIGLIRASGLLEYMRETFEGEGENLVAVCLVKRKGESEPIRGEFSWKDAKKANLLGKEGPWQTYPRRMMQMRARWPLRDVFADVLKGLHLREEVEDMHRNDAEPELPLQPPVIQAPPPPTVAAPPPPATNEVVDEVTGEVTDITAPAPPDVTHTNVAAEMEPAKVVQKDDPISSGPFPGDVPLPAAANDGDLPWALDRKLSANDREWLEELDRDWGQCDDLESITEIQHSNMKPAHDVVSAYVWRKACDLMDKHIERING